MRFNANSPKHSNYSKIFWNSIIYFWFVYFYNKKVYKSFYFKNMRLFKSLIKYRQSFILESV